MNVINEFESLMDAYKSTDISRTLLQTSFKLSKSAGGFYLEI